MDIAAFRSEFTEFQDATVYPTSMITFWADLAELQLSQSVWKKAWAVGVKLYVAHEITLAARNAKAGKIGGMPGTSGGIANSKTVGSATASYDSTSTSEKDAGYWNLTNYGKHFYRLSRLFGAGAIQL